MLHLIEKIKHGFLWAGHKEAHDHGGLGVLNLEKAGVALRLRWLWFSRTDPSKAWQGLDLQFSVVERVLFFPSTTMVLGDGRTAMVWEDQWLDGRSISEITPHLYACVPKIGLLNHS
jgi:hypothetical protein